MGLPFFNTRLTRQVSYDTAPEVIRNGSLGGGGFRPLKSFCSLLDGWGDWYGMKEDQHRFLSLLGQLPARLRSEQAGWVLNCQPHDIPALISSRLLKPLGNPAQNGGKFFCTADVLELTKDRSWLVKMTNTINQHWQRQNFRKKCPSLNGGQNGLGLHSRPMLAEHINPE